MRLRKKLLLIAALATGVIGGTVPAAYGHDDPIHPDPDHHGTCTWTVDKTASLHSNPSVPITSLNLSLGQTITVDYKIVVTRNCEGVEGFDPAHANFGANVVDSYAGTLATDLFTDSHNLHDSRTFTYSRDITAGSCESFDVVNTVDVVHEAPAPTFATDTNTLHVVVHCESGCTLTQGYWKTHSSYGPASKPDATWNLLPGGAGPDTLFFLSGDSWYEVFWTAPAGNAYYNLAHQYMAARLNVLDGASAPLAVTNAIAAATALFDAWTPAQVGALDSKNAVRKQFIALAGTLGSYNEGLIGPGHCDE
jgi:hypothetical protein